MSTYTVHMHVIDRAIIDSEERGFVKIHVRNGSDKILGANIGLSIIARVIHTYPTQAEGIKKAAMAHALKPVPRWRASLARLWSGATEFLKPN